MEYGLRAARALPLALPCWFLAAAASAAEIPDAWNTVGAYPDVRGEEQVRLYLYAAGAAYTAANSQLAVTKKPVLFCQPPQATLDPENYVTIFEKKLAKLQRTGSASADAELPGWLRAAPLEFVLLHGLMETFPCPTAAAP